MLRCFASLGIRGVPLDRDQMWDQCPTGLRWAAFHTEMCEVLHTSLKFLTHLRGTGRHLQGSKSCCTEAGSEPTG